jgi:PAS domain S-box-containing protein
MPAGSLSAREAEVLVQVGRTLAQTLDPAVVGTRIVESVCGLLQARTAAIYLVEHETGDLVLHQATGPIGGVQYLARLRRGMGVGALALRLGRAVAMPDVLAEPAIDYSEAGRQWLGRASHRAVVAVPLAVPGRSTGVLVVADQTGRRFDEREQALVESFAHQAALALENARLFEAMARGRRSAEILAESARELTGTLDPREVGERIVQGACRLLGANSARLLRSEPASGRLATLALAGTPIFGPEPLFTPDVGSVGECIRRRAAVTTTDFLADPRLRYGPWQAMAEASEHRATVAAPLIFWSEITGALVITARTGRRFDEAELQAVEAFAAQAAIALHNAETYAAAEAARAALRESQDFLERAQAVGRIGSWMADAASGRLWWSEEVYRIFGLDESRFDGTLDAFLARVHPDDVGAVREAIRAARKSQAPYAIDHRILRPDGSPRWVHERGDVVRDAAGRTVRMIGVVQDITDRRELEELLRQSQKMEAVGRLAGGVAHDFNNLLTVITGRIELLLADGGLPSDLERDLELIGRTAERAASLTRQLLAFSRRQLLQPRVLDLGDLVAAMGGLLRRLVREDIQLVVHAGPEPCRVRADPSQLEQVLINLAVNASDAMPGGGLLSLRVERARLDEPAARALGVRAGAHALLSVTDTGQGMDAATAARIFEPFFTTKGLGKGTGLGLATVYGIVTQSGGGIEVDTAPGRGTTFRIALPLAPEPEPAADDDGALPPGRETILLAEDDAEVRQLAGEMLRELGYTVVEAAGGADALRAARQHPAPIHLLVVGLHSRHGDGRDLAAELARAQPGVAALYTTDLVPPAGTSADLVLLEKPYTPAALARKVREAIDRRAPAA